jgi:pimeloyl-ACP methyl ester carboxylesterase
MNSWRWLLAILLSISTLGFVGCAREGVPRMVNAGGYRVRTLIQGHGTPAVVFISGGFGAALEAWSKVQPKVSQFTRSIAYDRGGTWKSEPAPLPRDSARIAAELHAVLRHAGIKTPCVLVGQSIGGIHVRVFAHLYPDDVAGIVLVDPTAEYLYARLQAEEPVVWQRMETEKPEMDKEINRWPWAGSRSEYEELNSDLQQARQAWPLPAVPVTLLTATRADSAATARVDAIKLELHRALLQRVPGAKHIVTNKSGHSIHMEEPDLVVAAIRDVVELGRRGKR